MKLLRCKHCGKIYKIVSVENCMFLKDSKYMYTDFGDKFYTSDRYFKCINCDEVSKHEIMECEDWVAHKVFEVKGN